MTLNYPIESCANFSSDSCMTHSYFWCISNHFQSNWILLLLESAFLISWQCKILAAWYPPWEQSVCSCSLFIFLLHFDYFIGACARAWAYTCMCVCVCVGGGPIIFSLCKWAKTGLFVFPKDHHNILGLLQCPTSLPSYLLFLVFSF